MRVWRRSLSGQGPVRLRASKLLFRDRNGTLPMMLNVSSSAADKLRALSCLLRVDIEPGGCHGFQYRFSLMPEGAGSKLKATDVVFETEDKAKVVVEQEHLPYLDGSTLTWKDTIMESGFIIESNPHAQAGCSCGVSFDLRMDPNAAANDDSQPQSTVLTKAEMAKKDDDV